MEDNGPMVSHLREQTARAMMECKRLSLSARAISRLRGCLAFQGQSRRGEARGGRAAADGVVAAVAGANAYAMVEMNSETDFVARNSEFQGWRMNWRQLAASTDVSTVDELLRSGDRMDFALATSWRMRWRNCGRTSSSAIRPLRNRAESVIAFYIHTVTNKIGTIIELTAQAQTPRKELARGWNAYRRSKPGIRSARRRAPKLSSVRRVCLPS